MKNSQTNSQPTPADHEQPIRQFIRRLSLLLALKQSLAFVTIWLFVWGAATLVLRATAATPRKQLLWGAVGIAVAIVAAVVVSRRQLPATNSVCALLDGRNNCGGLLMARADAEIGHWRMPPITLPRLRWQKARVFALFGASIAFVTVSLIMPVGFGTMNAARPMDVSREVENLSAQIEALKEAQIMEEAKAEALEQKLDQLGQEASGADPAKTWEALDHLNDAVEKAAREAAENASARQERLARAEALAEGLMSGSDQLDSKTMTEAMQTLTRMAQNAIKENDMLASDLSPETQEAIKSGALSAENLKDLSKALSQNKSALNQKLSKLGKSGQLSKMVNPNTLKGGAQANRRDNSGLSQFLKENAQKMSVEEAVGQWCENPGKGGVDRGRGDAAMTWTDGTSEKDAKFKEKVLPPSAVAGLNDSQLMGLSATAPTVDRGGVAAHGALNATASGGGSAFTQTILPRHKGAVRRYFDRPQAK
jgi:cell division protein FtsB